MGVDRPNYTQIPNLLLDDLLPYMNEAEMRVTLALTRLTFGYHRDKVEISLSKLQEVTRLSRQGVINGINAGIERGTIGRTEGKRGGFIYELIINGEHPLTSQRSRLVNLVDQSPTSQPNGLPLVNEVDQTSQRSRPPLVNQVDQNTPVLKKGIKERTKERTKEKPTARARSTTTHPNTRLILDAYVEALGYKPGNYGQEAKAAKQLAAAGYEPSDVVAAYLLLKQDPFWKIKHLSLQTLVKEIPAMQHALLNGASLQPNPTQRGSPPMDKNQAAAQQVRSMLKAHGKEDILHGQVRPR